MFKIQEDKKREYLSNVRKQIIDLLHNNETITWKEFLEYHPANSYEQGILINQLDLEGLLKYMKINIENNSSVSNFSYLYDMDSRKTYDNEMNNFLLPLLYKKIKDE